MAASSLIQMGVGVRETMLLVEVGFEEITVEIGNGVSM